MDTHTRACNDAGHDEELGVLFTPGQLEVGAHSLTAVLSVWLGITVLTRSRAAPARVFGFLALSLVAWSSSIIVERLSVSASAVQVAHAFEQATQGKVTILFFGYTNCPDVCPTTMANIATGLKAVEETARARIKVVFVTTDPRRDEPATLRKWLDAFDPSFIGLSGRQAEVNGILESLRLPDPVETEVTAEGYTVEHVSDVLVFTQDDLAHLVYPEGISPDSWARDLTKLVHEGWHRPKPLTSKH